MEVALGLSFFAILILLLTLMGKPTSTVYVVMTYESCPGQSDHLIGVYTSKLSADQALKLYADTNDVHEEQLWISPRKLDAIYFKDSYGHLGN
jgi:hypothetical protein